MLKAEENPSVLFLILSPEGMISSPHYQGSNACSESEYKFMCEGFRKLSASLPNVLLMPGTIIYAGKNHKYHNPAPIFYQGNQHSHRQEFAPHTTNEIEGGRQAFDSIRPTYKEIYTVAKCGNDGRVIHLRFKDNEFHLIPQICIEHLRDSASKITGISPKNSLQVVMSNSVRLNKEAIVADCFVHSDINLKNCRLIKNKSSLFKIVERKQHVVEYSPSNHLHEVSYVAPVLKLFGLQRGADPEPKFLEKTMTENDESTNSSPYNKF